MVCVYCGEETHVTNSRPQKKRNQIWRRRECLSCGAQFSTEERVNYDTVWLVLGADDVLRPFRRDKLFLSLYRACQHRKTVLSDAGGLTDTIIAKLQDEVTNGTLTRRSVIQVVEVSLNRFDAAASVAYRAFHAF